MSMKPLLIVMVASDPALASSAIRSVLDSDYKDSHGDPLYDLLVIIDGPPEKFGELAEFPGVRMVAGSGSGSNAGLREAIEKKYTLVCLISDDTLFEPSCFRRLADAFGSHPRVGFAGPKVYYYDYRGKDNVFQSAGCWVNVNKGRDVRIGEHEEDRGQYDICSITGYVNGCCIMARTSMVEKIGPLDESLSVWGEIDWCERGRRAGYESAYVSGAKMWRRTNDTPGNPYQTARNKFRYIKKYATPRQYRRALCWFIVDDAPRSTVRYIFIKRDPRRLARYIKGTWDGIRS